MLQMLQLVSMDILLVHRVAVLMHARALCKSLSCPMLVMQKLQQTQHSWGLVQVQRSSGMIRTA